MPQNKGIIKTSVNEAINCVAVHYNCTPEVVRMALAMGNKKVNSYVIQIAEKGLELARDTVSDH